MKKYKFDVIGKTLTLTADFVEEMNNPQSDEFALYQQFIKEIPGLKVVRKTHATPKSYKTKSGETFLHNQFKGLTYENMERFLSAIPNSEEYQAEYEYAKELAEDLRMKPYVLARDWFLTQFPKYRKNALAYLTEHPDLVKVADLANVGEAKASPATPATISKLKKAG